MHMKADTGFQIAYCIRSDGFDFVYENESQSSALENVVGGEGTKILGSWVGSVSVISMFRTYTK